MLQNILIALVVLVAVILGLAAMKPSVFRLQRSTTIAALPQQIFPHIADFHRWRAWSPWERLDPDMKRTYSGAEMGKGAVYQWEGNKQAGAGRMEITDAPAPSRVEIDLDFTRPFATSNTTGFTLTPKGGSTEVVWSMQGPQPFMFKLMSVFMSMEKMVGKDFERGLASLKAAAEGKATV